MERQNDLAYGPDGECSGIGNRRTPPLVQTDVPLT